MTAQIINPASPAQRGAADAYYGRPARPHRIDPDRGRLTEAELTAAEIEQYRTAYRNEEDRKEW